ncbi:hypothetical protein MMC07_006165 [Pseudocyphellaria aurata]|nr:hypothetical protein [Pseudocyphellaria aurata]
MAEADPSYIDYEAFLDPRFSPTSFANSLVLATNNASDTPLDLSTPLSRVLFDIQEIDTHIHTLSTKSAIPLLTLTKDQADAGQRIAGEVEAQVVSLNDGYQRLEKEVIQRYEAAEQVRVAAERLWQTVKIGRAVGRCLLLGRQLQAQMAEVGDGTGTKKEDHKSMVRASSTLLSIRTLLSASGPDEEGEHLGRINIILALQNSVLASSDSTLRTRSQQIVREFSLSSVSPPNAATATYAQSEETKSRTTSALLTLWLLSPPLLLSALEIYLRTCLTSSLASIARALAALSTLDRTLLEVSARCQSIIALESLLDSVKPPLHPELDFHATLAIPSPRDGEEPTNLLHLLLSSLDTSSLPSFFWRSLAEGLASRVAELVGRGGAGARALRAQREKVKDSIRNCVLQGSQGSGSTTGRESTWEREAAVMVGSVLGALGR